MDKQHIIAQIRDYLLQQEDVVFAYLFGSFIDEDVFRDIDTAVYTKKSPDLIRLGLMKVELDRLTGKETDPVPLNNLPDKNPAFAYEVTTRGRLVFCRDPEIHMTYKQKTFSYYMDTAYLRKQVDEALAKRMESDKFGLRNYV